MSFTRQFNPQDGYPEGELKGSFPNPAVPEKQMAIATALGINAIGMVEAIIHDLKKMIEQEQRYSIDGYILCLSRIISRDVAWKCMEKAFGEKGEPVPSRYQKLFERTQETRPISTMKVEG